MKTRTVTAVLPAPKREVFSYLADIENLPKWATEFARELKVEEGKHKVVNGLGEFFFEIAADEETGVIDMLAGPSAEQMALFPTRVVELPGEASTHARPGSTSAPRSVYLFTMFQGPGMSDELFEQQYQSLLREFENIEREFAR